MRGARSIAALGLVAVGCDEGRDTAPSALRELERLAYVAVEPRGTAFGPDSLSLAFQAIREPLLVDLHEVTRGDWRAYQATLTAAPAEELALFVATWDARTDDWPASFVTQAEAREYAARRGMRLPTAAEWLYCAVGSAIRPYPWGQTDQRSIANTLELGLGRLAPVGTFEAGRSPQGLYDLVGNVAEWVEGTAPDAAAQPGDARASVLGGSYRTWSRRVAEKLSGTREYVLFAQALPPASRADDVGFRCVANASSYLWERAPEWGSGAAVRERLLAVGRRFGRRALPLLDALATRPNAPDALDILAEGARQ